YADSLQETSILVQTKAASPQALQRGGRPSPRRKPEDTATRTAGLPARWHHHLRRTPSAWSGTRWYDRAGSQDYRRSGHGSRVQATAIHGEHAAAGFDRP